jgi:hypothetical protein
MGGLDQPQHYYSAFIILHFRHPVRFLPTKKSRVVRWTTPPAFLTVALSAARLTPEIFCENAGRAGRAGFVSDLSRVGLSKNRDGRSNPSSYYSGSIEQPRIASLSSPRWTGCCRFAPWLGGHQSRLGGWRQPASSCFGRFLDLRPRAGRLSSHPARKFLDGRPAVDRGGQSDGDGTAQSLLGLVPNGMGSLYLCLLGAMARLGRGTGRLSRRQHGASCPERGIVVAIIGAVEETPRFRATTAPRNTPASRPRCGTACRWRLSCWRSSARRPR